MTMALSRSLYQVQMDVRFSARYHQLCERWFQMLNETTIFAGLILSSAAVAALFKHYDDLAIVAAAVVALVHGLNLAVGSARKVTLHRDLYRRFQQLDATIVRGENDASAADAEFHVIEVDDPPISETFRRIAFVDNLLTYGHDPADEAPGIKLSWRERMLRATL